MIGRVIVLCALVSCGGGGGGECASTADCSGELECSGVNDGPRCGIGPREGCVDDDGCFGGDVCHVVGDGCSDDGIGSECGPSCVEENDCQQPGLTCDAGHCVTIKCDAGSTCAARQECDPGRIAATTPVYDRHSGCFDIACTADADCGDLFCVNVICQDAPGSCVVPMLVP